MIKSWGNPTVLKVDVEKREVWGTLAIEQPDKDGEVMDYEASKPYWVAWSEGKKLATAGKSYGNVRQMHSIALPIAGKLIDIQFDDATKSIIGCTKVTNDEAWKNCLEGVYTGFSLGGNYVGVPIKEAVTGHRRYIINPAEVSLVDNPCQPGATFDLICADGTTVQKAFVGRIEKGKEKPMANAALIDKAKKLLASADTLLKGIGDGQVKKGMYAIGSLANLICDLNWITQDAEWEASAEDDGSEVPGMLRGILKQLAEALKAMTSEEVSELIGTEKGKDTVKIGNVEVTKKQADHLEQIGKIGKKIHAVHAEMGKHIDELLGTNSEGDGDKEADTDEKEEQKSEKGLAAVITKALAPTVTKLNATLAENEVLKAALAEQGELLTGLSDFVMKMAAEPSAAAMPKANIAVTKAAEAKAADEAAKGAQVESKDPLEVMKSVRDGGPTHRVLGNVVEKVA